MRQKHIAALDLQVPAYMLPGLQPKGSNVGDLGGALHPDLFGARSQRLAEQRLEEERQEAGQRAEKEEREEREAKEREERERLEPLEHKLRTALRSKSLTEVQKNAVGEALAAVHDGRLGDALALLEEHAET